MAPSLFPSPPGIWMNPGLVASIEMVANPSPASIVSTSPELYCCPGVDIDTELTTPPVNVILSIEISALESPPDIVIMSPTE